MSNCGGEKIAASLVCFTAGAETDANERAEKFPVIFLTLNSDAIATLSVLPNTSGVLKSRIYGINFSFRVLLKLSQDDENCSNILSRDTFVHDFLCMSTVIALSFLQYNTNCAINLVGNCRYS